ncbi:MAG: CRTAC1 family protein, partial [Planctomycetota bacterium]
MRSDGGVEEDIENTEAWADEASGRSRFKSIEIKEVNGKKRVVMHSLSGHERNKLFLNFGGNDFSNASPLSGLDSVSDGRSFGLFDLDHDGWQDIALVNTNFPRIQIFRNNMGTMNEAKNSFVVIQLVGGNWSGEPNQNFSNRDGVGAKIIVETERQRLVREIRCGEGFSSQNSKNLIVGIGAATTVNRIQVNWPSGIQQEIKNVQSEQLVKFLYSRIEDRILAGQPPTAPAVQRLSRILIAVETKRQHHC